MRYVKELSRPGRDYGAYLDVYGWVYGDMSDPLQRAELIASLKRRDAITLAAARREEWRQARTMSTADIRYELRVKRYQIEQCGGMRPWNVRNCDIHTFRLLRRELRARGVEV